MLHSPETATLDGYALSLAASYTPHSPDQQAGSAHLRNPNFDYAEYEPEVGLAVADGVAYHHGSDKVSALAVRGILDGAAKLGIRRISDPDTAIEIVRDGILPRLDNIIAKAKHEKGYAREAATTLGALVFAKRHVITVGIGDTPVTLFSPKGDQAEGRFSVFPLTLEQCNGNVIYNCLGGYGIGRPRRNPKLPMSKDNYDDQVKARPIKPGEIYMVASDGLHGDTPEQRLLTANYEDVVYDRQDQSPQDIAEHMSRLPRVIEKQRGVKNANKAFHRNGLYIPKNDDLSVGIVKVSLREG